MTSPISRIPGANFSRISFGTAMNRARAHGEVARAVERRRNTIDRTKDASVKLHRTTGFVTVAGAGEVALDVYFPVWYIERPGMSFGGELDEGHSAVEGSFPTCSVMVGRWILETRGELSKWYRGATLLIVTTGAEGHQVVIHWHVEGKAMVNPLNKVEDTDGVL
jgi:hypothetical protein